MGRVDHGLKGDQAGADLERVQIAMERFPLVYCEMEPGRRHFSLIATSCIVQIRTIRTNRDGHLFVVIMPPGTVPYKEVQHASYTPLESWQKAIKNAAARGLTSQSSGDWLSGDRDRTTEKIKTRK